jgi:hypothetical protein
MTRAEGKGDLEMVQQEIARRPESVHQVGGRIG